MVELIQNMVTLRIRLTFGHMTSLDYEVGLGLEVLGLDLNMS